MSNEFQVNTGKAGYDFSGGRCTYLYTGARHAGEDFSVSATAAAAKLQTSRPPLADFFTAELAS
jgi:hypothetical protein